MDGSSGARAGSESAVQSRPAMASNEYWQAGFVAAGMAPRVNPVGRPSAVRRRGPRAAAVASRVRPARRVESMKTTAQLTFEKVRFDEAKDAHLVVSVAAPHADARAARPPVCVIPVLDVSGSMQGEKLHYAKQSILKLVDHLAPGDFCGVVVFSTEVETLAAPAEMTQERKDTLKAAVGRLGARQNTNLGGGLLAGLDHAQVTKVPEGMLVRVILFTDGLANEGPAKTPEELRRLLEANLGAATLSAFGYGDDADQELLRELSTLGKGNYAYVRSPEDALTAFARELGGLLSTYAQALEVRVTPRDGAELTEVVSDVDAREEGGSAVIRVPDLLADEVRHPVLGGPPRAAARRARRAGDGRRRGGLLRAARGRPRRPGAARVQGDGAVRLRGGRPAGAHAGPRRRRRDRPARARPDRGGGGGAPGAPRRGAGGDGALPARRRRARARRDRRRGGEARRQGRDPRRIRSVDGVPLEHAEGLEPQRVVALRRGGGGGPPVDGARREDGRAGPHGGGVRGEARA